jgi:hypothetical protein
VAAVTALRYRCSSCGNLTRFDVITTSTVKAFHHYTVGGDLEVEDVETIAESVDSVSCRWCGHGRNIEVVDAADAELADEPPGEPRP